VTESRADRAGVAAFARRLALNVKRGWDALVRPPLVRPPRPRAAAMVAVCVLVAAVIALMFLVDSAASDWARDLPGWFTTIFERVTNFGLSGWFLYPSGFALLCLAALSSLALPRFTLAVLAVLTRRCGFLFIAIGLPGLFTTLVKRMIGRARPFVGSGPQDDPFSYMPFIWKPAYASMPSGHSTTAVAAAIAIGAIWPRSRVVMWLYALIIMFSRIAILAHHPSDVLGGAIVGGVGAWLVQRFFAARRLGFSPVDLRPFPGPSWRRLKEAARNIAGRR